MSIAIDNQIQNLSLDVGDMINRRREILKTAYSMEQLNKDMKELDEKEANERRRQHLEMIQSELEAKNNKEQSMSYEEEIKLHNRDCEKHEAKLDIILQKLHKYEKDGIIEFHPSAREFKMLHDAGYCTCDVDVGYSCIICWELGISFQQTAQGMTLTSEWNYETLSWQEPTITDKFGNPLKHSHGKSHHILLPEAKEEK